MIELTNTPNLMGIEIKGDYNDLNELYDALSKITDLYVTQSRQNLEKQEKAGEITKQIAENGWRYYQDFEDCMLGLNYDIRHAYQGDRGVTYEENGADSIGRMAECIYEVDGDAIEKERKKGQAGNLYFTVQILYPWAIYYLLNLSVMVDDWYDEKLMKKMIFPYDEILCRKDQTIIEHFTMSLWKCLQEALGRKKGLQLFQFHEHNMGEANCHAYYGSALCNYYCDKKKKSKKLRKAMLIAIFYEMLGADCFEDKRASRYMEDGLLEECEKEYQEALEMIKTMTKDAFLFQNDFYMELDTYLEDKESFGYEERDEFLERFGDVDWERMKW